MGHFPHLPPESIALIVDDRHGYTAALKACPSFLTLSFRSLKFTYSRRSSCDSDSMRTSDQCVAPLSQFYPTLATSYSNLFILPPILDGILDHFMAFRNIRELKIRLDTFHFVDRNLRSASRYHSHFQPTLRSLDLTTLDRNPKDAIVLITFFPSLEELSLLFYDADPKRHGSAG